MTLPASLLRELDNRSLSVASRAELCCELAQEFENKGDYEEARKALGDYWRRIGERPRVKGLEPNAQGEVLLRAGVLTGLIGSRQQIHEAQETAKNLISESLTIFQNNNYRKKIAEAQIELALCYWRTGEINEARDVLADALSRLTVDNDLKAKAILRIAIVELEAAERHTALSILTNYTRLFQKINNQTLKGSYYSTLANVLERLWESERKTEYLDRALVEYAAASYYFEKAEHRCYLASVENNLGLLYFTIHRFNEAHKHLDHARRVFASLKDSSSIAQVDDTRASVFLAQGRMIEAERVARSAVRILERSGRHDTLAEALVTQGRVLARLTHYGAALAAFRRAIDLAQRIGVNSRAADAALAAFQELGEHLAAVEKGQTISARGLGQEKKTIEHHAIMLALRQANGSVTDAARILGISYQTLGYMLNTRHKDLLKHRTPVRRRSHKQANKRAH